MNLLSKQGVAVVVLSVSSSIASAIPTTLSFSGTHLLENTANPADWLFDVSSSLAGSVVYDSDVAATGSSSVPGFTNTFTLYGQAFSNLNFMLDGHNVSSTYGTGMVGNDVLLGGAVATDIFLSYSGPLIPGNTFSGFSINGWNLLDANFAFNPMDPTTYNSADLPTAGDFTSYPFRALNLDFASATGELRTVTYQLEIAPAASVPEPTSASLLAIGMTGVLLGRLRSKKRIVR